MMGDALLHQSSRGLRKYSPAIDPSYNLPGLKVIYLVLTSVIPKNTLIFLLRMKVIRYRPQKTTYLRQDLSILS